MSSWSAIDWEAPRPTPAAAAASLRRLRLRLVTERGHGVNRLLEELRAAYSNGGALLATFDVEDDPVCAWFASRNRLDEYGLFEHLLICPELQEALPELYEDGPPDPSRADLRPVFAGSYALDGYMAALLMFGGAYDRYRGSGREAKLLSSEAVAELLQDRYEDALVYVSHKPWSPWFSDIAWDLTGIVIDKELRRITVLALTDID